ncbi:MAG: AAA family ATPase [Deltaproteobacteria bacterium]|nr:AAA family ATPase [Deltaproteobacteria bacterium]
MEAECYIPRKLEDEIRKMLYTPEIIAIVGARQSGKTTLLRRIADTLDQGVISFLDFEDRDELQYIFA